MGESLKALLVGIIQGLTEFLPVSSSGHIELAQVVLGTELESSDETAFSVILHLATVFSTIVVLRKEIWAVLAGLFRAEKEAWSFALKIVLSMLPAAFIGLKYSKEIDAFFQGNLVLVGSMLFITALLLLLADYVQNTQRKVGFGDALLLGVAQAIAILPGISRSGATIGTAVLLRIDRSKAAHFSFLMVLPLILGKVAKDLLDGGLQIADSSVMPFVFGFFGAFIAGIFACQWMIALVRKSKLIYFAIYCALVGSIALGYSLLF